MALAAVCLIISLLAVPAVYANFEYANVANFEYADVDHIVGDDAGWNLGVDYEKWASGKRFSVGDNLIFKYGSSHGLNEVGPSDYKTCTTGIALMTYKGGNNTISLHTMGDVLHFICPVSDHCRNGMKLRITVEESIPLSQPPKGSSSDAIGSFGDMNKVVLGISIVFAGLVRFIS